MQRLMRPPRSPSLPSAATNVLRHTPSWRGQRESHPLFRADNAASCCSTMSPSGWTRAVGFEPTGTPAGRTKPVLSRPRIPFPPRWVVSARRDSNPNLHGLSVPRLPVAPRADGDHGRSRRLDTPRMRQSSRCRCSGYVVIGPFGWTRTTTARGKNPACSVDTTKGWSEWRDSNPHLKAWKARRQPLPHIRSERTGIAHRSRCNTRRLSKTPLVESTARHGDSARMRRRIFPVDPGRRARTGYQNKKGLPGDRPRRPVPRTNAGLLRACGPPSRYRGDDRRSACASSWGTSRRTSARPGAGMSLSRWSPSN